MKCFFILWSLMSLSLFHPAVAYNLEVDADHRKNGLNPRATFTSDNSYMSKGTITLDTKETEKCVTRKLAVQVVTPSGIFLPSLLILRTHIFVEVHCGYKNWDTANGM